jgi:hypothetical protein
MASLSFAVHTEWPTGSLGDPLKSYFELYRPAPARDVQLDARMSY